MNKPDHLFVWWSWSCLSINVAPEQCDRKALCSFVRATLSGRFLSFLQSVRAGNCQLLTMPSGTLQLVEMDTGVDLTNESSCRLLCVEMMVEQDEDDQIVLKKC